RGLIPGQGALLDHSRCGRGGIVEEGVAVADNRLWNELLALGLDVRIFLDGGADGHDLDQTAANLVDEHLDADYAVGLQGLDLVADMGQAILASLVYELGDLGNFA